MKENDCIVIIPTYNNALNLRCVIEDVVFYTNHIIIVDDGSTDETLSLLTEYNHLRFYADLLLSQQCIRRQKVKGVQFQKPVAF